MIRFGEFEADETSGELSRNGQRIKLQDLPFRMLVTLLQRPGVVVSREDLRAVLWGQGTYVDAEAGLNTAAAKLREALGDNVEQPRFIETIPKRGYRFIGPIGPPAAPDHVEVRSRPSTWILVGLALIAIVLAASLYLAFSAQRTVTMAIVRFHNETGDAHFDSLANDLTDAAIVSLASNPRYAVIGNSPVLHTERIFEDVRKVGQALAAPYVILGQLQMGEKGMIARVHFIRTGDEKHLWASQVDLADPAGREQRITAALANGVAVGLSRR